MNKYQVSTERRVLDLESEVQGFNTHWGNILLLDVLFSCSKAPDANLGIIANFGSFEKPLLEINWEWLLVE